jgi:hypothetical protein
LTEPEREKIINSLAAAGVLTIVSGVLTFLPAIALLWVLQLNIPNWRIVDLINYLLIGGIAITGAAIAISRKNLMLGVIGAAVLIGNSILGTLLDADLLVFMPRGVLEPSNALPDIISYIVSPLILALLILALVFFAKSKRFLHVRAE